MSRATPDRNPMPAGAALATGNPPDEFLQRIFAGLLGLVLGLALLKFSTPVIMEKYVEPPEGLFQWIFYQWPGAIAHWMLVVVAISGLAVLRWKTGAPWAILALPMAWLIWQAAAATQTVNAKLSHPTLIHFVCCVGCFYLGVFCLSRVSKLWPFWNGIGAAFVLMLASGWEQHFGGLKDTQAYFFQYVYPTMDEVPPELLQKMLSQRIFATQFYPNALAGVILMLLPILLAVLWSTVRTFTIGARRFLVVALTVPALACLYWSGSKGGWLLMLLIGLISVLFLPMKRQFKLALVGFVLVLGLAGFGLKYAGFFKKGATSVAARFDYWHAAMLTAKSNPLFGTGPGTFAVPYQKLKKQESEMARLTHNDYLEQASDSGVPGFLAYSGFIVGTLVYTGRKTGLRQGAVQLAVWLGVLGWALQGLMEFGLYIPASAWIAFTLLGWLVGRSSNQIDSRPASG